jgi:glutathione S-transferase
MLTVHHLGKSQSERIVWLCEELGIPYTLQHHVRDPVTGFSPPELRALTPMGAAPVIQDGDLTLPETMAVIEYILTTYRDGGLVVRPDQPGWRDYLYWLHFANGSLQPVMGRNAILRRAKLPDDAPLVVNTKERLHRAFSHVDNRLAASAFLGADRLTVADIVAVFSLTTMRYFMPVDLSPYPNIRAYLQRIGALEGYRRAMAKSDPGMELLLT